MAKTFAAASSADSEAPKVLSSRMAESTDTALPLLEVLKHSCQKALSAKPMGTPSHCCKAARSRPGFQRFTVRRPP